jgi:hypothetical protein
MKHTPTREILEAAARQQHDDGRIWCEATRQWEGMGISPEVSTAVNVCYGCQQPLAHSNHRWSRKRMAEDKEVESCVAWIASQKEASDHERPD